MKNLKIFALLLLFAAFVFNACEDTTTPVGPDKPDAATNLMATSKTATSVTVKWTASPSETDSQFAGYVLTVTGGAAMAPIALTAAQNPYTVAGLQEGTIYTFTLQAKFDNEEVSDPVTVQWSPAARFTETELNPYIRIYETTSSYGSGLVIYDPNSKYPKAAKVADGANWTLGLITKNNELAIGSPKLLDYTYGTTPGTVEIGKIYTNTSSLDDVYGSDALNTSGFSYAEKKIDLKQYNASFVIVLRYHMTGKSDWNYAKVLVKYAGSSFLAGATGNQYVELQISHQLISGIPYAGVEQKPVNNTIK